jgi:hypothetical protein
MEKTKGNSFGFVRGPVEKAESDRSISVHISRSSARLESEYCEIWREKRARQDSNLRPPA